MKILFLHNNFPGQYRRIAAHLRSMPEVEMRAGTLASNKQDYGVRRVDYALHREVTKDIHPTLVATERAVLTAQAAFKALYALKSEGWAPDLVCSHSGWGPSLFVKELWPQAKLLALFEWYYRARGSDADFLEPINHDSAVRAHMKNIPILLDLAEMDWGTSPTRWQFSQFPEHLRHNMSVLHEGVDCDFFSPGEASVEADGRTFTAADEVITYVARGMEPYRGFPQFMAAVAELQQRRPDLHVLIAGQDRTAYGKRRGDGKTHREHALASLDLDESRIHFLGLVPLTTLRAMFRITRAHVYLTVPFVLSWSMLEAMATGALIVGSRTAPVEELITDGENGVLTDFFDVREIVDRLEEVLRGALDDASLRQAARGTIVDQYALDRILPRQWELMQRVARGERP
ncbi:glycosyltransferase [Acuticoccus mangrovi]|uniref:Glycosyltransferase n=1 Tax=Acuticoccus mangrovi TaxID=2796142 RepID=A0A934IFN1_9HYPH|nr:glycosyltransferase [Acuticoccus mangrovi]MBJ3774121.1 glycosyltransferase [Acuticoccus mangrovi]